MEELLSFVREKMVRVDWGDFAGMAEPSLADLGALRVLVDAAIAEKMREGGTT